MLSSRKLLSVGTVEVLPPSSLPTYDCDVCMDTGYVIDLTETAMTQASAAPCTVCSAARFEARVQRLFEDSGIDPAELEKMRFETWQAKAKQQASMADIAKDFVTNNDWSLAISGQTGRGKTHMLVSVGRAFAEQGKTVRYISVPAWNAHNRLLMAKGKSPDEEILEDLAVVDLLLIDELPAEGTAYQNDNLDLLINERYRRRKKTMVSSNIPPDKWPERIVSRLSQGAVVVVFGIPDYRGKK